MGKKIMELRGLIYGQYESEAAFARALDWDRQKLNKITNGDRKPDIEELYILSKSLGCEIDTLAKFFLDKKVTEWMSNKPTGT